MRRLGLRLRTASVPALVAVTLAAAGCSSGSPSTAGQPGSQPPATACKQPPPADLPHAAGQVTETDTGAFCLGVNQRIDAFLTEPDTSAAAAGRWARIKTSDPAVLANGDDSVLTTPLSVTAGIFVAHKPGTAVLSSVLPNGTTWSVTVVVR